MLKWNELEGQTINGRYEIKKVIGEGGAGKVYLANDLIDAKQVAVKTANPQQTMSNFKKRFEMEARTLSKLDHPNIIKFYEQMEIDGIPIIIMEYVEGISLEKKLRQEKTLPIKEVMDYASQILSALEAVHNKKIFHRDVKADNVHITVDGKVKLLDFGIIQETIDQDLTRQGSVIGTVSHLAPEIITSKEKVSNAKTDVYSLGVMLYQLLVGVKPFKADPGYIGQESQNNLARKIVYEPAVSLVKIDNSIPGDIDHFVMKMLEKDPAERYQSTKEALSDLKKIQEGTGLESMKGYYAEETKEYSMKKQIIVISIAIAVVLLILIIALPLILI